MPPTVVTHGEAAYRSGQYHGDVTERGSRGDGMMVTRQKEGHADACHIAMWRRVCHGVSGIDFDSEEHHAGTTYYSQPGKMGRVTLEKHMLSVRPCAPESPEAANMEIPRAAMAARLHHDDDRDTVNRWVNEKIIVRGLRGCKWK